MNLYVNQKKIDTCIVETSGAMQENTAKKYFLGYAEKLNIKEHEDANFKVCFELSDVYSDDGFGIVLNESGLLFKGGKRGVIYSVFSFLERVGFRFFTPELEKYPAEDVFLEPLSYEECSPFSFRDILSIGATDKTWSLKQKLNSNLWNSRGFKEAEGGSCDYAGIPAHSLTGEFLLKPYTESNPEYFSFKDGVRMTDRWGQICMTNEAAIEAAANEVLALLEANPDKNMVDVSMGDNENFCECDACKAEVEKYGLTHVYMDVVCKIARKVKEKYPHVLVHTLAYLSLCDGLDFQLDDNIMIQYCHGKCATHAITDETCEFSKAAAQKIKDMTKVCSNLQIWNYTNCFKYELFEYPYIHNLLKNMCFYAECGATGVLNEGVHRFGEDIDFACMYELRSYLLSKIMWNPYMSDEEYRVHITEFCEAFYGDGYPFILKYIDLYQKYTGYCAGYDAHAKVVAFDAEGKAEEKFSAVRIIQEEHTMDFINEANEFLTQAISLADETQKARIEKLKTCVLYYELYWTMKDVLLHGSNEEISLVITKNKELIQRILDQKLVITFWGQLKVDQDKELETMGDVPPSEWNYKW